MLSQVTTDNRHKVSLEKLFHHFPLANPFAHPLWDDFILGKEAIARYIKEKKFKGKPLTLSMKYDPHCPLSMASLKKDHEMRVAWLVTHGWTDAIEIDVGIPALNHHVLHPVQDGNHRVAAAVFKGDSHILASCGGEVDLIEQLV